MIKQINPLIIAFLILLMVVLIIFDILVNFTSLIWIYSLLKYKLSMIDKFKSFLSFLKVFPIWLRSILLVLISAIILILTLSSCGQLVRVTVKDTPNGVSITTSQNKKDTSSTNISINPNINFNKH